MGCVGKIYGGHIFETSLDVMDRWGRGGKVGEGECQKQNAQPVMWVGWSKADVLDKGLTSLTAPRKGTLVNMKNITVGFSFPYAYSKKKQIIQEDIGHFSCIEEFFMELIVSA